MKKILFLIGIIIMAMVITACQNINDVQNETGEHIIVENIEYENVITENVIN